MTVRISRLRRALPRKRLYLFQKPWLVFVDRATEAIEGFRSAARSTWHALFSRRGRIITGVSLGVLVVTLILVPRFLEEPVRQLLYQWLDRAFDLGCSGLILVIIGRYVWRRRRERRVGRILLQLVGPTESFLSLLHLRLFE